jgi:hypothetical protein
MPISDERRAQLHELASRLTPLIEQLDEQLMACEHCARLLAPGDRCVCGGGR